jgi:hypothetical protein
MRETKPIKYENKKSKHNSVRLRAVHWLPLNPFSLRLQPTYNFDVLLFPKPNLFFNAIFAVFAGQERAPLWIRYLQGRQQTVLTETAALEN